jgi:6-phosphofructokinase 1
MSKVKRIGVLTGGGDVPGLNPAIRQVVNRGIDSGFEIVGIRRGWGGLLNYNIDDPSSHEKYTMKLDRNAVRTIDRTGGTFLHTSRTNPAKTPAKQVPDFLKDSDFDESSDKKHDFTPHILKNLEHLGIDALIPIGGDDTLSYAERLYEEGFQVVAIPKTMDNDVYGTDYCIGFSTAVSRSVQFINNLRTSTGSHERIAVVELFGRNSGETSLIAALLAKVDRAIISEVPFDVKKLADMLVEDKNNNPSGYAVMTISEGAQMEGGEIIETGEADAYGHRKLGGIGQMTADEVKKITGENMIYQNLGYLMRSGAPDSLDLMVGTCYGELALRLVREGVSNRMVALREGKYTHIPIGDISKGLKRVDTDKLYDVEQYKPTLRNVEGLPMFLY